MAQVYNEDFLDRLVAIHFNSTKFLKLELQCASQNGDFTGGFTYGRGSPVGRWRDAQFVTLVPGPPWVKGTVAEHSIWRSSPNLPSDQPNLVIGEEIAPGLHFSRELGSYSVNAIVYFNLEDGKPDGQSVFQVKIPHVMQSNELVNNYWYGNTWYGDFQVLGVTVAENVPVVFTGVTKLGSQQGTVAEISALYAAYVAADAANPPIDTGPPPATLGYVNGHVGKRQPPTLITPAQQDTHAQWSFRATAFTGGEGQSQPTPKGSGGRQGGALPADTIYTIKVDYKTLGVSVS